MQHSKILLFVATLISFCGPVAVIAADATNSEVRPVRAAQSARPMLTTGMAASEIRGIVGEPIRVKPLKAANANAEVWYYSYSKLAGVTDTATGIREVPYVDPITGVMRTIPELSYSLQKTVLTETTELLMVDGTLTSAKRYRHVRRDFN